MISSLSVIVKTHRPADGQERKRYSASPLHADALVISVNDEEVISDIYLSAHCVFISVSSMVIVEFSVSCIALCCLLVQ